MYISVAVCMGARRSITSKYIRPPFPEKGGAPNEHQVHAVVRMCQVYTVDHLVLKHFFQYSLTILVAFSFFVAPVAGVVQAEESIGQ